MIIRVTPEDIIARVKVVDGTTLALLDTTGTLTQKYQARVVPGSEPSLLISPMDTPGLISFVKMTPKAKLWGVSPIAYPDAETLLPIAELFRRLESLVGSAFKDAGQDQERSRGSALHQLVCRELGFLNYSDDGRFPDVKNQLLEIKLQTSPTIDLGLVRPDSEEMLDIPKVEGRAVRHCDVRYAVFCARTDGNNVTLTHLYVSTGKDFGNSGFVVGRNPEFWIAVQSADPVEAAKDAAPDRVLEKSRWTTLDFSTLYTSDDGDYVIELSAARVLESARFDV